MNEVFDDPVNIGAVIAALLRDCAAFETGLTDVRKSELKKQLRLISHGAMTDGEFDNMLDAPSIIKPGAFLPALEAVGDLMIPQSKRILENAFEEILSAGGPLSEGAAVLIDGIRTALNS